MCRYNPRFYAQPTHVERRVNVRGLEGGEFGWPKGVLTREHTVSSARPRFLPRRVSDPSRGVIDEQVARKGQWGGKKEKERESKILSPLFCHGIRMEAREEVYIEIVFVSVKGEGRFVGVLRRMKVVMTRLVN